ncbi:MAG: hypothetical protein GXO43_04300 [Crenarchaeota archaeon]|nr:hypothetical protein [Thermoproteota archaeon]
MLGPKLEKCVLKHLENIIMNPEKHGVETNVITANIDLFTNILACNELKCVEIFSFANVSDNSVRILSTYDCNDLRLKIIEIKPNMIKAVLKAPTGRSSGEIHIYCDLRDMTKDKYMKFVEVKRKYEKIITDRITELEKRKELVDSLQDYRIREVIKEVADRLSLDELEMLVNKINSALQELRDQNSHIQYEYEKKVESMQKQLMILREFIKDKGLISDFVEWYKNKKKLELENEIEEEAMNILGLPKHEPEQEDSYEEDDYDDC